jgi:hypothetical protein
MLPINMGYDFYAQPLLIGFGNTQSENGRFILRLI